MKEKILIIEDNFELVALMTRQLQTSGYNVISVGDAIQGIQMAKRSKPNLIILDIMLPGGGGISLLKRLKQLSETKKIPVIILTGVEDDEVKREAHEIGAAEYLEKPYNAEVLLQSIQSNLKSIEETSENKKILVIDDDEDFLKKLVIDLNKFDYEIITATDAAQGMKVVHDEHPDLIILDLRLPGGGGFSFYNSLKSSSYTQDIPVIVLTALADKEYKKKMLEAGVDYYFQKPYNLEHLLNAIEITIS